MKLIKSLNKQKIIKGLKYIIIPIISFYLVIGIYSFIFEQDKIKIDRYNFGQLEKAKSILKNISEDKIEFYSFNNFNEKYNSDITPIKNCYAFSDSNGDKPYIFGFQLESLIYKFINFGKNYAYPSYNRPNNTICLGKYLNGSVGGCTNSRDAFIETISNPCRD
ncbi:MAG: hypothetical protein PHH98_01630 [Candidatus Gracilibacteria bacterium]|nr:hypothetical protein [Candidatus Gracilibacteria bacterium]